MTDSSCGDIEVGCLREPYNMWEKVYIWYAHLFWANVRDLRRFGSSGDSTIQQKSSGCSGLFIISEFQTVEDYISLSELQ